MSYEYHIRDIKKNEIFCEFNGYGHAFRFKALEDGYLNDEGYWMIKSNQIGNKKVFEHSVHQDSLRYGPELYIGDKSVPYLHVIYLN